MSFTMYSCVQTLPGMKILSVLMSQTINDIDSPSEKQGGEKGLWTVDFPKGKVSKRH